MRSVLIVIATLGLGHWGIATAHADPASYLAELRSGDYLPGLTFTQPPDALLALGYRVCTNTANGMEQRAMIRDVWNNGGSGFDAMHATALVNIAQQELYAS
ncbi:hypothetical protein A5768_26445 [Mycolicibacterium fortuitum]|nr:hypothetical protein A5768_26445 [Mycolicibacterium fortuitum]